MKYIFLSVLIITLSISCKKDVSNLDPFDPYVGTGTARLNGKSRVVETRARYPFNNDSISIKLSKKDASGITREMLTFSYLPIKMQRQNLTVLDFGNFSQVSAHYATFIADGDVTGEIYSVNQELSTNFIEIQKIDSTTMDIEGRFEVLLTIYPPHGKTFHESPDTLHFTDGVFKVRVKP